MKRNLLTIFSEKKMKKKTGIMLVKHMICSNLTLLKKVKGFSTIWYLKPANLCVSLEKDAINNRESLVQEKLHSTVVHGMKQSTTGIFRLMTTF